MAAIEAALMAKQRGEIPRDQAAIAPVKGAAELRSCGSSSEVSSQFLSRLPRPFCLMQSIALFLELPPMPRVEIF